MSTRALVALALACCTMPGRADVDSMGTGNPNATLTASADLRFNLNIDKFLFFRVGDSAYPTASSTINTVAITSGFTIPPGAVVPVTGNNTAVNWSGATPALSMNSPSLPVEVRSNAGQISIRANAITTLTSGSNTIPLSQITVSSSDANLPAPLIPDTGSGAPVNVTGSSFSNLVTNRSATWTFALSTPIPPAGSYTGQISFTASSP